MTSVRCCTTSSLDIRSRLDGGPGRAERCRQVDTDDVDLAVVRSVLRNSQIGGLDLRFASMDSLRDTVGVVTQEAHMFNDTIRANLLYAAPEADEAQMQAALRGSAGLDIGRGRYPTVWTRCWVTVGTGCPVGRSNAWPSPGSC